MSEIDYNTFLMFGDSITEYSFNQFPPAAKELQYSFGSALQNVYTRKLQVLHRGFAGYTTRDAVKLIRGILTYEHDNKESTQNIKIAYIFFGTNDARNKGSSPMNNQHIPLDKFISNMELVINEFEKRSIPFIVISPGLHDSRLWEINRPGDLKTGDFRDDETNKLYSDELQKLNVPVLHMYNEMKEWIERTGCERAKNGDYSDLLTDGIHYTGISYRIMFNGLMRLIKENYPEFYPENMEIKFPHWSEMTESSFDNFK